MEKFWKYFEGFRRITIFLLGAFCFFKGVLSPENTIPELIIGMVMVGVLPLENILKLFPARRRRREDAVDS